MRLDHPSCAENAGHLRRRWTPSTEAICCFEWRLHGLARAVTRSLTLIYRRRCSTNQLAPLCSKPRLIATTVVTSSFPYVLIYASCSSFSWFLPARSYASAVYAVVACPSVRLSVRPSQASTVSKRLRNFDAITHNEKAKCKWGSSNYVLWSIGKSSAQTPYRLKFVSMVRVALAEE